MIAVVTVVAGRHAHLRAQREHLARCEPPADLHVVVAIDDDIAPVLAEAAVPTRSIAMPRHPAGLPVAAARNAGAVAAIEAGADVLVFLDVDCLPAPGLLDCYAAAVARRPDVIACGPVTYLPPDPADGWTADAVRAARAPHPARPDPAPGVVDDLAPELFWSLSFAVAAPLWPQLGFYEGYVGYGGEDTDFAATAAAAGIAITMVGGADAYHQHHPVSRPPVEHVDDIARNCAIYLRRHGVLPMRGWLDAFTQTGLLASGVAPPRRTDAIRVATVPARHEYLDAVLPATVRRVRTDRVTGWEPDPLLTPAGLADLRAELDVVHVHFGYDHLEHRELAVWLAGLHRAGVPLVVTVHDLRNPHHPSRDRHDRALRLLLGHAARAVTLTDAAADECAERFGLRPEVVPHPTLLDTVACGTGTGDVLVPLKALRGNVREPVALVAAVVRGASGRRVRVLVDPAVLERPELAGLGALDVDLLEAPRLPHDELVQLVADAHAVVLPYRYGTHSGWVELARDVGTHVVAPDCGHYAAQWPAVTTYGNNEQHGLDADSLAAAVADVSARPTPAPAERVAREAERDLARAWHDALYRSLSTGRAR